MLQLPSMWNLIISTIAFFVAAWYVRRYLNEQGIPKGMTSKLLVFTLAFLVSWGTGFAVDWVQQKVTGSQATTQNTDELSQLLKEVRQQRQ